MAAKQQLVEGVDYYLEGAAFVFTPTYLLRRGYCCNNGCRHCPYKEGAPTPIAVSIVGLVASEPERE